MTDAQRFECDPDPAIADVFRLYVGNGNRFSWGALADATGVPLSTLKSYARGATMPFHVALKLIAKLPPEAGNMLIRSSGYRLAPIEADDANWHELGAEASLLTFEILDAEKDGRIDHVERGRLKRRTESLIAKAESVLS